VVFGADDVVADSQLLAHSLEHVFIFTPFVDQESLWDPPYAEEVAEGYAGCFF
jgi:hypothetical protein